MATEKLREPFEGLLSKYTNVVKGYQFRWFVLDPETGTLIYYLNESERSGEPRGSVNLAAAVISPSDEDSNTFTVNSAAGEVFKLRATDARARHDWVTRIRAVAEMHTLAIAKSNPPLRHHDCSTGASSSAASQSSRTQCSTEVLDTFNSAKRYIQQAEQNAAFMTKAIEDLPGTGEGLKHTDPELLMLKAAAQTSVITLNHSWSILQELHIGPAFPSNYRSVYHPEEVETRRRLQHTTTEGGADTIQGDQSYSSLMCETREAKKNHKAKLNTLMRKMRKSFLST